MAQHFDNAALLIVHPLYAILSVNQFFQENNNIGGGGGLSAVASGLGEVYDGGSRDKMVKVLKMQEASWPSK